MIAGLIVALLAAFAAGFLLRNLFALLRNDALDGEKRILAGGVEVIQLGRRGAALHAAVVVSIVAITGCFVVIAGFVLGTWS